MPEFGLNVFNMAAGSNAFNSKTVNKRGEIILFHLLRALVVCLNGAKYGQLVEAGQS